MTVKGFIFMNGAKDLLQNPLQDFFPDAPFAFLNTSTVPLSPGNDNTTIVVVPPDDYSIVPTPGLTYGYNTDSTGCTATITGCSFSLGPSLQTRVIRSWYIKRGGNYSLLYGGNLETPVTIPLGGGTLALEPITINLGTCETTPAAIFLLDTFAGANSTPLTSHTMNSGRGWIASAGTFWLQGNRATGESDSDSDSVYTDGLFSNFELLVDVTPYSSSLGNYEHATAMFRFTDALNYWLVDLSSDLGLVRLIKFAGGVVTVPGSSAQTVVSGTTYTIGCECRSDSITVTFNGASLFTVADGFQQYETRVGLRVAKSGAPPAQATWQNFRVNPLRL